MFSPVLADACWIISWTVVLSSRMYACSRRHTSATEKEYYARETANAVPIQFIGIFVAIIMAVGSGFAAMNTMYAAVARRVARDRHAARARLLARQHPARASSWNRCCLPGSAALLGCLLVLPLNGITTGIGNT